MWSHQLVTFIPGERPTTDFVSKLCLRNCFSALTTKGTHVSYESFLSICEVPVHVERIESKVTDTFFLRYRPWQKLAKGEKEESGHLRLASVIDPEV